MKKFLYVMLAAASALCLILGIAACDPTDPEPAEPTNAIRNITSEVVDEGVKIIITAEDGSNYSFIVPNGRNGTDGTDGTDGLTPYIGENGHWWVGGKDLGVSAQGNARTDKTERTARTDKTVRTDKTERTDRTVRTARTAGTV